MEKTETFRDDYNRKVFLGLDALKSGETFVIAEKVEVKNREYFLELANFIKDKKFLKIQISEDNKKIIKL